MQTLFSIYVNINKVKMFAIKVIVYGKGRNNENMGVECLLNLKLLE